MRQNRYDANPETYELKIVTFEHCQPEEFLQLMNNLKRAVHRTGNKTAAGKINYIRTLLHGKSLWEFDELASQNAGTKNSHLKFIQEGLLRYYFPINALSKQNRAMGSAIYKPQELSFKRFVAHITELKNYLPLPPSSSATNKTLPKELNNILLHAVPNGWGK